MEASNELVYEVGKWYMVNLKGYHDIPGKGIGFYQIPAKFIGIVRCDASKQNQFMHDFPHPGQAVFENVEIDGCGYEGINWDEKKTRYTAYRLAFRPVTETELWAVRAIESFQRLIAGRQQSFEITLPNGFVFQAKIKPPSKKDNVSGSYTAVLVNPQNGEEKRGMFEYDGKSCSPKAFLLQKFPGWEIISLKLLKARIGTMQS